MLSGGENRPMPSLLVSASNSGWSPSPAQLPHYRHFFMFADQDRGGKVDGRETVAFLSRSGLNNQVLKQIWTLSVSSPSARFLTAKEFIVACRLVAHAQNGKPVTIEAVAEFAQVPLPLPIFQGIPPLNNPVNNIPNNTQNNISNNTPPSNLSNNSSNSWKIQPSDRKGYDAIFKKFGQELVGGSQAVQFFVRSGMDKTSLIKVWNMSDLDKDNMLDSDEFAIAMHLVVSVTRRNKSLPDVLPREIYPAGKMRFRPPKGIDLKNRHTSIHSTDTTPNNKDPVVSSNRDDELLGGMGGEMDLLSGIGNNTPKQDMTSMGAGNHSTGNHSAMTVGLNDAIGGALSDMGLNVSNESPAVDKSSAISAMSSSNMGFTPNPSVLGDGATNFAGSPNSDVDQNPARMTNKSGFGPPPITGGPNNSSIPNKSHSFGGNNSRSPNSDASGMNGRMNGGMYTQNQSVKQGEMNGDSSLGQMQRMHSVAQNQSEIISRITDSRFSMSKLSESSLGDLEERYKELSMQTAAQKLSLDRAMEQLHQDTMTRNDLQAKIGQMKMQHQQHYEETEHCVMYVFIITFKCI